MEGYTNDWITRIIIFIEWIVIIYNWIANVHSN